MEVNGGRIMWQYRQLVYDKKPASTPSMLLKNSLNPSIICLGKKSSVYTHSKIFNQTGNYTAKLTKLAMHQGLKSVAYKNKAKVLLTIQYERYCLV